MPTPNPDILKSREQSDKQRQFGRLRAQQRAATPLITLLREQKHIQAEIGEIRITFIRDDAVYITVQHTSLSPEMFELLKEEAFHIQEHNKLKGA